MHSVHTHTKHVPQCIRFYFFVMCQTRKMYLHMHTHAHMQYICLLRPHFLCNAACSRRMVYWLVVTQQWSVWFNLLDVDEARDFDSSFSNLLDTHVGLCFFVGRSNPPKGSNHCIIIHFAVLDWRLCDWNDIEITWVLGVRLLETNCIPSDF